MVWVRSRTGRHCLWLEGDSHPQGTEPWEKLCPHPTSQAGVVAAASSIAECPLGSGPHTLQWALGVGTGLFYLQVEQTKKKKDTLNIVPKGENNLNAISSITGTHTREYDTRVNIHYSYMFYDSKGKKSHRRMNIISVYMHTHMYYILYNNYIYML